MNRTPRLLTAVGTVTFLLMGSAVGQIDLSFRPAPKGSQKRKKKPEKVQTNFLEGLPKGWGILADDLMAGLYAGVCLWVAVRLWIGA